MPTTKTRTKKTAATKTSKTKARMSLAEAMDALKKAGSEQTRKTYTRHGATGPMFGVSFATLKELMKRIGVDHELAVALWETGNFDARNLAVKIVEPARVTPAELDRWVGDAPPARMCSGYVAMIASEGPHAEKKLAQWLGSKDLRKRAAGWTLLGQLALRDTAMADAAFERRLTEIERVIHDAPNAEREGMNAAVIAIGCRSRALRKAAVAAAKRIGRVEIDYGDTSCKTPDAAQSIEKTWAHATAKKYESPAAQERDREVLRRRC